MEAIGLFKQGMLLVVMLSAPALAVAVLCGVLVSFVQAIMQIQDQTLPFAVKLVAVGACLALTGRWLSAQMTEFLRAAFDLIANSGHG